MKAAADKAACGQTVWERLDDRHEQMQTMAVTVPAGMQGGMPHQIQTPSGIRQVIIPWGLCAGQQFHVSSNSKTCLLYTSDAADE